MIKFETVFNIPSILDGSEFETYHDQYQEQMIAIYHQYRAYILAKQSLAKDYVLIDNFNSKVPLVIFGHFETFIEKPPTFMPIIPIINDVNLNWFHKMFSIIYQHQMKFPSVITNIIAFYVISDNDQLESWKHVVNSLFNVEPMIDI